MSTPYSYIKNLDTGAILPWHAGFAAYKDLNFEPYYGPIDGVSQETALEVPALVMQPAADPLQPKLDEALGEISVLKAQLSALLEAAATPAPAPAPAPAPDRAATIKDAVSKIDPANYGGAGFGFPAMPKVADIQTLTGLTDVTREEVLAAMS